MIRSKQKRLFSNTIIYLILLIISCVTLFPVLYTILGSFKGNMELLAYGNQLFPKKFVLENYAQAWKLGNFKQYTWNSIYMTTAIVIGSIFTTTIAGYVFERGRFKGKNIIFTMVVSSMFVSLGSLTLYPTFRIAKVLGINRSLWGVVIIRVFGLNVTNLFITRSYIRTISSEIDEAAKMDGCSFLPFTRASFSRF